VQQHDGWSLSAKLEMNADAIDVHPGHGLPPWLRGIETWMLANFNMAAMMTAAIAHPTRA
jgi:predicted methyltransferase